MSSKIIQFNNLKIIGVTGTNGKTTVATLLFKLFRSLGYNVALVSTVENRINEYRYKTNFTTPENPTLISFFKKALRNNVEYVFMECSSHGIVQNRIAGLKFTGGIFTNLTRDHLDYHKTLAAYAKAKKKFFDQLPKTAFALANADDKKAKYMLQDTLAKKYFYSLNSKADFTDIPETKLLGKFNKYNTLAIYATAILLGIPKGKTKQTMKKLEPPSGRLEFIKSKNGILGVVDYAHTPNALENVLNTLKEILPKKGRIITVVGCGGDRDKSKRPLMGEISHRLSDYTIFTSDNPRSENPEKILDSMTEKLSRKERRYECNLNRSKSISSAVNKATSGDIILIAGKGHEDYQIIGNRKIHFSDKEELEKAFNSQFQ